MTHHSNTGIPVRFRLSLSHTMLRTASWVSLLLFGLRFGMFSAVSATPQEVNVPPSLSIQQTVMLDFDADEASDYVLEQAADIDGEWTEVDPILKVLEEGLHKVVVPVSASQQYFRLSLKRKTSTTYHVRLNGTVCVTWPCPEWTATQADGEQTFDSIDLTPLKLSESDAETLRQELGTGKWMVTGTFVDGPKGPAGVSKTLKIESLKDLAVMITNDAPKSLQMDPYALENATLEGTVLSLDVRYGGGCQTHDFQLFMSPDAFMESFPVQANLWLQHEDNDDRCKALVSKKLTFDTTPLIALYRQQYGKVDDIRLHVLGFVDEEDPRDRFSVLYEAP